MSTLKADRQFKAAGEKHKVLERFAAPDALVAYLTTNGGDLDEKDRVYRVLVCAVQARSDWRQLATALIWLGLWPGLSVVYGRRVRDFAHDPDELVTEIAFIVSTMVEKIDLRGVKRLAATMVLNVGREVRNALKRRWAGEKKTVDIDGAVPAGPDRRLRVEPAIADRELPVDASDVAAVRDWLTGIVGADADLVIGAAIYGYKQRELAVHLDISHGATRKRLQRAVGHIGELLRKSKKPMSHFGP